VHLTEGATVKDLLNHLGIGEGEAKQYFIRHKSQPVDYQLEEGIRVAIFPAIAGG
jgi:sulfur carrier protein ThiS